MKKLYQQMTVFVGSIVTTTSVFAQSAEQTVNSMVMPTALTPEALQQFTDAQVSTVKQILDTIIQYAVKYSFQVLGGFIVLGIGWMIGNKFEEFTQKFLEAKKIDVTVSKFIAGTVKFAVLIFAGIVALSKFGIEIAPLIAGLSVAGVGISFALQGPLSNYAAGATLIFTKPFKVGDIISVAGVEGQVVDMKLPRTELKTMDGSLVVVPNKHIIGEIIENFSIDKRVDLVFGVAYDSNMDQVIEIIRDKVKIEERITKDKEPKIGISEFGDSSVNITARFWCKQDDYLEVIFALNKAVFDEFNTKGIVIPFPQRDVNLYQQ